MNYADHGFCRLSFEVGHFFEQVSHSADLLALIFVRRGASSVVWGASCFVDRWQFCILTFFSNLQGYCYYVFFKETLRWKKSKLWYMYSWRLQPLGLMGGIKYANNFQTYPSSIPCGKKPPKISAKRSAIIRNNLGKKPKYMVMIFMKKST